MFIIAKDIAQRVFSKQINCNDYLVFSLSGTPKEFGFIHITTKTESFKWSILIWDEEKIMDVLEECANNINKLLCEVWQEYLER